MQSGCIETDTHSGGRRAIFFTFSTLDSFHFLTKERNTADETVHREIQPEVLNRKDGIHKTRDSARQRARERERGKE